MYRLRRWLPWMIVAALVVASRMKVPGTRSATAQLRLAAECGFVPGGQAIAVISQVPVVPTPPGAALPGHRVSQRECMKLATTAMSTSTTLGARVMAEARHQWAVFRADSGSSK